MKIETRQEFQDYLLQLLLPLKSRYDKNAGCARLELGAAAAGYGNRVAGLEGFSRVLWGLVPYWAGGGRETDFSELYRRGLTCGADPAAADYWGDLGEKDQRMVEMAAISYGILLARDQVWEPLSEQAKENLASWLYQINAHAQAENNWQFFKVLVNTALKSVGKKWSAAQIASAKEKYESYYLGNGWYSDGKRPQKDYYTSFGIHFYCLLYAKFMGAEDPAAAALYKQRARCFAQTFCCWFDDEGKALPFGRSLTYRFAQTAFFSACALADVECLPWGVMKGIVVRNLTYWANQPMCDNAGVLTVGYTYPNLLMSEAYNSTGSPYWALKTFAVLALGAEHPFWKAPVLPLPRCAPTLAVPECDMLICRRPGEVVALTAGQYPAMEHPNAAEKYAKFAYSSRFGFCVARSCHQLEQAGTDSMLAFYLHGMYYVRRKCSAFKISGTEVYAKWSPVEGIEVETWLVPTANGHIRRHRIQSEIAYTAYDCGFSYPNNQEQTAAEQTAGLAQVADANGYSRVMGQTGMGQVIAALPNLNLIFPNVLIPAVRFEGEPGSCEIETKVETEWNAGAIKIGGGNCYALRD